MKLSFPILSETNQKTKESLYDFIDGKYDNIFTKEQIEVLIELSFLFNHLKITDDKISHVFVYNNITIKQNHQNHIDNPYITEEFIMSIFRNEERFKSCLNQFLKEYNRDKKINNILGSI